MITPVKTEIDSYYKSQSVGRAGEREGTEGPDNRTENKEKQLQSKTMREPKSNPVLIPTSTQNTKWIQEPAIELLTRKGHKISGSTYKTQTE